MPVIKPKALTELVASIFQAAGAPESTAQLVARSLVSSDLVGHASHGVVRVKQYLDAIAAGDVDPRAEPRIVRETPVIAVVDGQWSFGQVAAHFSMEVGIEKARNLGLSAVALDRAYHVGRLGEWVQMAADAGMIGLAFCNGGRVGGAVAPFGGRGRILGTNPIAAGIPVAGRPPVIIDFATSATAEGKLRVARNRGQSIPEGWIVGPDGQPSTNPEDFYAGGALLPAAGHKGYGLSLLVEFLGGLLTGRGVPAFEGFKPGNGVLFLVLAVEPFRDRDAFLAEAAELCQRVKSTPPAAGFDEVLLPGEPEWRTASRRAEEGIPVDDATWGQLAEAAARYGVSMPEA
ncbi:MAG: Ldh family oxidoreductase [Anaerolineae bacterium]